MPPICSRDTTFGTSSTGPGSSARTCAPPTVQVTPGSSCTAAQCAPRARRAILRIRAATQVATGSYHSPPGSARGSRQTASAAAAAASSTGVRAAGGRSSRRITGIARTTPSGSGGIGPPPR